MMDNIDLITEHDEELFMEHMWKKHIARVVSGMLLTALSVYTAGNAN